MFANALNSTDLLSRYKEAIIAANVEDIQKAKYVVLSGRHTKTGSSTLYQTQLLFNQAIVESCYHSDDLIVVEDSREKDKNELCKDQIPSLSPDFYDIQGWDDAESCQRALVYKENHRKVRAAIKEIFNYQKNQRTGVPKIGLQQLYNHYLTLIKFADSHPKEIPLNSGFQERVFHHIFTHPGDKKFFIELNKFLSSCQSCNEEISEEFVKETFPKRQNSFIDRLSLEKDQPGRVYAFTGRLHCEFENNPFFYEEVQKLMDFLKKSHYIILNAAKLTLPN